MILRFTGWITGVALAVGAALAMAAEPVDEALVEKLSSALAVPAMGLKVESVRTSEIPGMYEVQFSNGPIVYSTSTGDHFILGDMYATGPDGFVNLGEKRRDAERLEAIAAVDPNDMIIFSPEGETRAHVTVFTDVTCFYCQKLHKEVPELNKRGVEVRYLAYPRAGVGSDAFRQLATAWCAADRQTTLTRLKNRETLEENVCAGNPVAEQYRLGQQLGVRGTPALVTAEGQMIPGYQSVDDLMVTLGLE